MPSPTAPHPIDSAPLAKTLKSNFGISLAQISTEILSQETIPQHRALPEVLVSADSDDLTSSLVSFDLQLAEIQRATVAKANPLLTAHTAQSLQWGTEL